MGHLCVPQPTNDLDLGTVESLESFLAEYQGCLLVASHDRAFMAGLDRLFVLKGDGLVRLFEGSYSEVGAADSSHGSRLDESLAS